MMFKATRCKGKLIKFHTYKRNCVNANGKCCASNNYGTGNVSRAEKSQEHCGYCFTGVPTYEKCAGKLQCIFNCACTCFLIGMYCCSLIPNHQSDGACDFHSKGSSYILKGIQWNPSITDTLGTQNFVRYNEVSRSQGLPVYFR